VVLLVQRLIEAYPVVSVLLLVGSVLLAVSGWHVERQAHRALQEHQGPGQNAGSPRRAVFMANVAQVLQLLPLIVITIASFVALRTCVAICMQVRLPTHVKSGGMFKAIS
jgi:hypothetical protein